LTFKPDSGEKKNDFHWGPSFENQSLARSVDKKQNRINVLIACESAELSDTISRTINEAGDFCCVVAENAKRAVSLFLEKRPEVIIMSYGIESDEDGIKAAREIFLRNPRAEIIILTNSNFKMSVEAESAGVELFLNRDTSSLKIVNAVRAVMELKKPGYNLIPR